MKKQEIEKDNPLTCPTCEAPATITDKGIVCPECTRDRRLIVQSKGSYYKIIRARNVVLEIDRDYITPQELNALVRKGIEVDVQY